MEGIVTLATIQKVLFLYYSCLHALLMVFLSLVLYHWPQWSASFDTWYLMLFSLEHI